MDMRALEEKKRRRTLAPEVAAFIIESPQSGRLSDDVRQEAWYRLFTALKATGKETLPKANIAKSDKE
jgi:hypothetical protein